MKCKHCRHNSLMGGSHYSNGMNTYCKQFSKIRLRGFGCDSGEPSYARMKFLDECVRNRETKPHKGGHSRGGHRTIRRRQGCGE